MDNRPGARRATVRPPPAGLILLLLLACVAPLAPPSLSRRVALVQGPFPYLKAQLDRLPDVLQSFVECSPLA